MARGYAQSQTRAVMQEKEALARRLLGQGLTTQQICVQLRCSRAFVNRIKQEIHRDEREAGDRVPASHHSLDHLAAMRTVCDALAARLLGDGPEEQPLLEAEAMLISLARNVEVGIEEYASIRGPLLRETAVMLAGLTAVWEDLAWVELWRQTVPPADIHARLSHALRSAINAISLLHWSWAV